MNDFTKSLEAQLIEAIGEPRDDLMTEGELAEQAEFYADMDLGRDERSECQGDLISRFRAEY